MAEAGKASKVSPRIDLAEVGRVVEELFPEALGVWVYGSHADGTARRGSDLDIAILPEHPLDRLDLFHRGQDLALRLSRDVDLVDLRSAPDLLRYEAIVRGIRVTARDPLACDRFETAAIAMYQNLQDEMREWIEDIAHRARVF
jgi:predicted nucleotidyltransferase